MVDRIPITKQGAERLKKELTTLLSIERPAIQRQISEAREHGDLRENAEYHAAKERQGFIEGRIQEINAKLPHLQVVEIDKTASSHVAFGATVTMINTDTEEEITYQIVGPEEANLKLGRISFQTPIGKALIGKEEGDVVNIQIPKGTIEVEITKVIYAEFNDIQEGT